MPFPFAAVVTVREKIGNKSSIIPAIFVFGRLRFRHISTIIKYAARPSGNIEDMILEFCPHFHRMSFEC